MQENRRLAAAQPEAGSKGKAKQRKLAASQPAAIINSIWDLDLDAEHVLANLPKATMQLLRSGPPRLAKEHTHVSIRGMPFRTEEVDRRRATQDCGVGATYTELDAEG